MTNAHLQKINTNILLQKSLNNLLHHFPADNGRRVLQLEFQSMV